MNRTWFDKRPTHLRPVVGWWEWHTRWRFMPGRCRECRCRKGAHKLGCSRRARTLKPTPIWVCLLVAVFWGLSNMAFTYILAATGLPQAAGFWTYIGVCVIVLSAFNWLGWHVYLDWQQRR